MLWGGGEQIKSLASDVLQMVKETDILIDDLPGLEKTERCGPFPVVIIRCQCPDLFVHSEQLEELRHLQIESEEEAQTLRQVAEEAGARRSICI